MARNAAPNIIQNFRYVLNWRVVAGVAVTLFVVPSILTHLFLWRVESALDLEIDGKPFFAFYPGTVDLSRSSIVWKDRFAARPSSLVVRYPILQLLSGRIPVSLEGTNVAVSFGPKFSALIGHEEVLFDVVSARVISSRAVGLEIDFLDAQSKTIQFQLSG